MKKNIAVLVFSILCAASYGQAPLTYKSSKYIISPQISQQLKTYVFVDTGTLKGSMNIEVPSDGKKFFNQKNLDCYTHSFLRNDTIYITGHMGGLGWGFLLALFRDSCIAGSFALSDGKIYTYNESDSTILSLIYLPNVIQKLTLSAKPRFTENERISGFIELKSEDFYYVFRETRKKSYIKLTAFFKTSLLKKSY